MRARTAIASRLLGRWSHVWLDVSPAAAAQSSNELIANTVPRLIEPFLPLCHCPVERKRRITARGGLSFTVPRAARLLIFHGSFYGLKILLQNCASLRNALRKRNYELPSASNDMQSSETLRNSLGLN